MTASIAREYKRLDSALLIRRTILLVSRKSCKASRSKLRSGRTRLQKSIGFGCVWRRPRRNVLRRTRLRTRWLSNRLLSHRLRVRANLSRKRKLEDDLVENKNLVNYLKINR